MVRGTTFLQWTQQSVRRFSKFSLYPSRSANSITGCTTSACLVARRRWEDYLSHIPVANHTLLPLCVKVDDLLQIDAGIPTVQPEGWEPALTLTGIIDETDRGGQSTVGMGSSTPPHVQQTNWEAFHRAQRSFRCSQYLYWTRWERGKAQKLEYLVVSWYEDYGIILAFTIVE